MDAVEIPGDKNAMAADAADATLKGTKTQAASDAFVKWLSTAKTQQILQPAGLRKP
ncbi:substrate-binding domain-containing protein [Streptomyces lavendulae]|uniref:substrate-binding domain-containing protein n=1 Tax=Streptomyces lavendulae TaxID=1914 RepID=UPI0036C3867A